MAATASSSSSSSSCWAVGAEDGSDEWDAEGFEIPSLTPRDSDTAKVSASEATDVGGPQVSNGEEKIYLGPHGAPSSQGKQQEVNTAGRRQQLKKKLKEADGKFSGTAKENKVENLRELMGTHANATSKPWKSSPRDWLDPHCHESEFERDPHQRH